MDTFNDTKSTPGFSAQGIFKHFLILKNLNLVMFLPKILCKGTLGLPVYRPIQPIACKARRAIEQLWSNSLHLQTFCGCDHTAAS
jgi:hypothetical protein